MTGSALGSRVALALSEEQLRYLFMGSIVLLGGRSFVGATKNIYNIVKARKPAKR